MWFVAAQAILENLSFDMRLMALKTRDFLPVNRMTLFAIEQCVMTGVPVKVLALLDMTTPAPRCEISGG